MTAWRLSILAERQMEHLLGVSIRDYGTAHARNYRDLILLAMDDVGADPTRFGAARIPRFADIWEYQLRHSKDRAPRGQRIRVPWHKLIYRPLPDGTVEILAIVGRSYPSSRAARQAERNTG